MRVKFPMYQRNFLILIKLVLEVLYHHVQNARCIYNIDYNIYNNKLRI